MNCPRRVLIIDFGSSTTDFTAALGLDTQPLDFGHSSLGAGIIEGQIMRRMIETAHDPVALRAALYQPPAWTGHGIRAEMQDGERTLFQRETINPFPVIEDIIRIDRGLSVDIELTKPVMDVILATPCAELDGLSWQDALNDCLARCRQQVGDPDLIILTGGAARMGFVRRSVEETFVETKIVMSPEPEFAIAKGLALYGRLMLKTTAFRQAVDELIDENEFATIIADGLPDLIKLQAGAVAASLAEHAVRPAITAWRDIYKPRNSRTIDDIGQRIALNCAAWTQSEEAKIKSSLTWSLNGWKRIASALRFHRSDL